jgi:hypothetical protein
VERADGRLVRRHPGEARGSDPGRGIEEDVTFVDGDHDVDDALDAAYRDKYRGYDASFVNPMMSPEARSTTLRFVPRSTSS